jgi:hypothetical protein
MVGSTPTTTRHVPPEQVSYAAWLAWGTRLGFFMLVASAIAYFAELLPAFVPLARLPELWQLSAGEFVRHTGTATGWGWIVRLRHGDFASLAGIAVLSGCSLGCLGVVTAIYARRRDWAYVAICAAEIAVLLLAASGLIAPSR